MENTRLDDTNRRILACLADDARAPYSEIARQLNLSPNTVRDRILALERRKVILGYHAILDEGRLGFPERALALTGAVRPESIHSLLDHPQVRSVYRCAGKYSVLIEMVGRSLSDIREVLQRDILPEGSTDSRIIPVGRTLLDPTPRENRSWTP